MLGQLAKEFEPARVVPVAFHVDYFNDPWKDPFSDPRYSRREMQYSLLYTAAHNIDNQSYLHLTPLLMIDGRVPMVGSNDDSPAKARAAIRDALAGPAPVALNATWAAGGEPARRELVVSLRPLSGALTGKSVLVQAVTIEDGLTTKIGSGELKDTTYQGRFTARAFAFESIALSARGADVRFPIAPPPGGDPARTSVVVLVQDEATGRVLQARRVEWAKSERGTEDPKAGSPATKKGDPAKRQRQE